jgi:ferritin
VIIPGKSNNKLLIYIKNNLIKNLPKFENFTGSTMTNKNLNEQEVFGVSEEIRPNTLPSEIESTLNARLGDEYTAYFFYKNAANWCKGVNYPKAAAFFNGEADAELIHAQGIQDYLTQWNLIPMIPPAPTQVPFESLIDVINKAYQLEYNLFMKYSADQQKFLNVHPATFNFVQTYVNYQTAEVAEYSDYLNALNLIDTNSKLDILFFEDKYFG